MAHKKGHKEHKHKMMEHKKKHDHHMMEAKHHAREMHKLGTKGVANNKKIGTDAEEKKMARKGDKKGSRYP